MVYKIFDFLHISSLLILSAFIISYIFIFNKTKDEKIKIQGKYYIILLLILVIAIRFFINLFNNLLDISNLLPVQLCAIVLLIAFALLIFEKQILLDICYFVGLPATILAVLFPYISVGEPLKLRLVFFLIFHSLLALVPLYIIIVRKKLPSFKWLPLIFIVLNIIAFGIIYPVNLFLNRNFMFLMRGPENTPLKLLDDLLSPVLYIIALEILAVTVLLVMSLLLLLIKKNFEKDLWKNSNK